MLKKYVFIITVLYTLGLTTVSLMTLSNLPNVGINFADKIFHFIVYSVLAYLWFSTFFLKYKYKKRKAIWYAALFSIIFGIIIEVLQGSVTASRHTDVYDAIANTLGVLIMVSILLVNKKMHIKN